MNKLLWLHSSLHNCSLIIVLVLRLKLSTVWVCREINKEITTTYASFTKCLSVHLRTKWLWVRNAIFYFPVFLEKKHSKPTSPQAFIFFWSLFKIWDLMLSPQKGEESNTVLGFSQYISHTLGCVFYSSFCININRIFSLCKSLKATYTLSHKIKLNV